MKSASCRIAIDIGGTFTDVVVVGNGGEIVVRKIRSSPEDYSKSVLATSASVLREQGLTAAEILHGTTVATNAVLQRRGAVTALVTTAGFRDILEIGRLRMPRLYDIDYEKPKPLVPRALRYEVDERIDAEGKVVRAWDPKQVEKLIEQLRARSVESVAIALLNSYVNDRHEREIKAFIEDKAPELFVTASADIGHELGEYERTSTAVANAYVMPILDRYLGKIEEGMRALAADAPLLVMQSNGGLMPAAAARSLPVFLIESGPAAGVVAAASLARASKVPNLITLDVGGTTAKASLVENFEIAQSGEFEIGGPISKGSRLNKGGGFLLRLPAIDIAEVGAGGGSIVGVDEARAIAIGPESAGAFPGPVAYGLGGERVTMTDVAVSLGYLNDQRLRSGQAIHADRARAAVQDQLAGHLGLTLEQSALAAFKVGVAAMARVIRAVTIERGRDPRDFMLLAFGGMGALFAVDIARSLEIPGVIVPPASGVFSALGLLDATHQRHIVRRYRVRLSELSEPGLRSTLRELQDTLRADLGKSSAANSVEFQSSLDMRYRGQTYSLQVPIPAGASSSLAEALWQAFEGEHRTTYGFTQDRASVEVSNLRLVATIGRDASVRAPVWSAEPSDKGFYRKAFFNQSDGLRTTQVVDRGSLGDKWREGPLIIEEYDATTLVPPGARAQTDERGNIVIETGENSR